MTPDEKGTTPGPGTTLAADVASALAAIKSVLAIINGLTLTNTLLVLITDSHYSGVLALSQLHILPIIYSVVIIANVVRFYHGNIRHLDSAFGVEGAIQAASGRHRPPRGGMGADFFVVVLQSLIFSVASFYVYDRPDCLVLLIVLLASDVIWVLYSERSGDLQTIDTPQESWLMVNSVGVVLMLGCYIVHELHESAQWTIYAGALVLFVTLCVDYRMNWHFYFPPTRVAKV